MNFLREHWQWFITGAALVAAFTVGRYTAQQPEIHETEALAVHQTVWTRTVYQREETTHRVVYRERITTPDGTVKERETEKDDTHETENSGTVATTQTVETEKLAISVIPHKPDWRIGILAGTSVLTPSLQFGASLERRIFGPFSLGVLVLARQQPVDISVFGSLSVEF